MKVTLSTHIVVTDPTIPFKPNDKIIRGKIKGARRGFNEAQTEIMSITGTPRQVFAKVVEHLIQGMAFVGKKTPQQIKDDLIAEILKK